MSLRRSSAPQPSSTEANRSILENAGLALPYKIMDQVIEEPVAVPFNWEHIPGRSNLNAGSHSMKKIDCDRKQKDEKLNKLVEDDDAEDDDLYSDAIETLSSTESFSMNCSVSGLDILDTANNTEKSSTDKQAQDFMMSRFLPAAKAMTLQPPQHAPRKQSIMATQPRDFTKLVSEKKEFLVNRPITDIVPYNNRFQEEEEEEESDHETDDYADISAKGCGLFSHSCIKNSLCLLNPVPETNQFPMCSAYEVGKSKKSSHIRSYRTAPVIKKAWDAIHKSKSSSGATSPNMHEARKKWTSGSNRYSTYSGELKHLSRVSSSFRRSGGAAAGISSYGSKPQPPFPGARLLGDSKQAENNKIGKMKYINQSSNSMSLSMEKTLYIDTESKIELPCSNLCSVGNTEKIDTIVKKEKSSLDSLLHSLEDNLDSEIKSSRGATIALPSMLSLTNKEDKAERLRTDQESNRELIPLQPVQSSLNKDTNIYKKQIVVVGDSGKGGDAKCVVNPLLPPPLPKSPSESWLCHALPLVSLKNSFRNSRQGTQCHVKGQGCSRASSFSKWETIVKTSNLHHDYECCSKELTIYKS